MLALAVGRDHHHDSRARLRGARHESRRSERLIIGMSRHHDKGLGREIERWQPAAGELASPHRLGSAGLEVGERRGHRVDPDAITSLATRAESRRPWCCRRYR